MHDHIMSGHALHDLSGFLPPSSACALVVFKKVPTFPDDLTSVLQQLRAPFFIPLWRAVHPMLASSSLDFTSAFKQSLWEHFEDPQRFHIVSESNELSRDRFTSLCDAKAVAIPHPDADMPQDFAEKFFAPLQESILLTRMKQLHLALEEARSHILNDVLHGQDLRDDLAKSEKARTITRAITAFFDTQWGESFGAQFQSSILARLEDAIHSPAPDAAKEASPGSGSGSGSGSVSEDLPESILQTALDILFDSATLLCVSFVHKVQFFDKADRTHVMKELPGGVPHRGEDLFPRIIFDDDICRTLADCLPQREKVSREDYAREIRATADRIRETLESNAATLRATAAKDLAKLKLDIEQCLRERQSAEPLVQRVNDVVKLLRPSFENKLLVIDKSVRAPIKSSGRMPEVEKLERSLRAVSKDLSVSLKPFLGGSWSTPMGCIDAMRSLRHESFITTLLAAVREAIEEDSDGQLRPLPSQVAAPFQVEVNAASESLPTESTTEGAVEEQVANHDGRSRPKDATDRAAAAEECQPMQAAHRGSWVEFKNSMTTAHVHFTAKDLRRWTEYLSRVSHVLLNKRDSPAASSSATAATSSACSSSSSSSATASSSTSDTTSSASGPSRTPAHHPTSPSNAKSPPRSKLPAPASASPATSPLRTAASDNSPSHSKLPAAPSHLADARMLWPIFLFPMTEQDVDACCRTLQNLFDAIADDDSQQDLELPHVVFVVTTNSLAASANERFENCIVLTLPEGESDARVHLELARQLADKYDVPLWWTLPCDSASFSLTNLPLGQSRTLSLPAGLCRMQHAFTLFDRACVREIRKNFSLKVLRDVENPSPQFLDVVDRVINDDPADPLQMADILKASSADQVVEALFKDIVNMYLAIPFLAFGTQPKMLTNLKSAEVSVRRKLRFREDQPCLLSALACRDAPFLKKREPAHVSVSGALDKYITTMYERRRHKYTLVDTTLVFESHGGGEGGGDERGAEGGGEG